MAFSAYGDIGLWKIVSNDGRWEFVGYLQQRDGYAMSTEIGMVEPCLGQSGEEVSLELGLAGSLLHGLG